MTRYLLLYITETEKYLAHIDVLLSKHPKCDMDAVFRDVHSMKGMAKALALEDHARLLQEMETLAHENKMTLLQKAFEGFVTTFMQWKKEQSPTQSSPASAKKNEPQHHNTFQSLLIQMKKIAPKLSWVLEGDAPIPQALEGKLFSWLVIFTRNTLAHAKATTVTLRVKTFGKGFVLEFNDNGRGIDLSTLLKTLPETELTSLRSQYESQPLTETQLEEILNTLCRAGVSTTQAITDLSGRGFGLNALKHEIEKLGGTLRLIQTSPKGTTFEVRIP